LKLKIKFNFRILNMSFNTFKPFEHQLSAQQELKRMEGKGGGFLCDQMGLGKTSTMAMHILSNHKKGQINLIVCPFSLLSIWKCEINKTDGWNGKFIKPEILIYHGTKRKQFTDKLHKYDFVITTYAIIGSKELNYKKWHRTILDESHNIKNGLQRSAPKCAQAAYQIGENSKVRFCITGTPFNNRIKDIASQAKFVGVKPYCDPTWWNDNEYNESNMLCWKKEFVIRRTKDGMMSMPNYHNIVVNPTDQEEKLTNILRKQAADDFKNWKQAKRSGNNLARIELQGKILGLIQKLRITSNSYFCGEGAVDSENVLENCAKVDKIITDLDNLVYKDQKKGVVVFSQFTSFLSVLEQVIETTLVGVEVYKFTGSLNSEQRNSVLKEFNESREPRIILVSLMAGGVGVSLHHGSSTVLLAEPYYNPFMEAQAEERVHRLGQTHQVNVYRYQMENSVENWINSLKQKKLSLAGGLDLVKTELVPVDFNFNDIAELFKEHVSFINDKEEIESPKIEPKEKVYKIANRTYKSTNKKFAKIPGKIKRKK
jgi:transcription termination factor 2